MFVALIYVVMKWSFEDGSSASSEIFVLGWMECFVEDFRGGKAEE